MITKNQAQEARALLDAYRQQEKAKGQAKKAAASLAKRELSAQKLAVFADRRQRAWEMRAAGKTFAEIGKAFGVTKSRASSMVAHHERTIRRANTPPPRPGSLMTLFVR